MSPVSVQFLGSGDAFGSGGRFHTCIFVCEAYFFEKRVKFHLDYRTLFEARSRLECKRIILTHMSQDVLSRVGELEIEHADDGTVVDL